MDSDALRATIQNALDNMYDDESNVWHTVTTGDTGELWVTVSDGERVVQHLVTVT